MKIREREDNPLSPQSRFVLKEPRQNDSTKSPISQCDVKIMNPFLLEPTSEHRDPFDMMIFFPDF